MLDLTPWAPVDCICSGFCSDPDDLRDKGLTFAAAAEAPIKDGTLNYILNYAQETTIECIAIKSCIDLHALRRMKTTNFVDSNRNRNVVMQSITNILNARN